MLTADQVAQALPPSLKRNVTQDLVDQLNNISSDPVLAQALRENFLSYTKVLLEGRFKIQDYLNAVMYVSFKLMGNTNREAYIKTFPDRYTDLKARGASDKDISSYVAMYNKGKLVNLILEQSLVPIWVLNQDAVQKAINTQVEIMTNEDFSPMARTQAANSLLNHLKKPEAAGPLVNISMNESSGIDELKGMLAEVAAKQREAIAAGVPTKAIAAQKMITVEREESP